MDCREFDELIIPYLTDDKLTEKVRDEFKQHYLSCDRCWHEFEEQLKLKNLMKGKTVADILGYEPEVDRAEELAEYAQASIEQGKPEEAIQCLKEARKLRPDDEEIERQLEELSKKIQVKTYMMPFKLLKNKSPIHEIQIMKEDYDRTIELSQKGDYTLVDLEGQVLWQEEHVPFKIDDISIPGILPSPVLPQTKVISFTDKEGAQTGEMIIRINRKPDRTILSFRIKKN